MPYITREARHTLDLDGTASNAGELNYKITQEIIDYMRTHNNYQGINDVLGAIDGARLEFYRRWAVPYEDYKCQENGDVYPTGA